MGKSIFFISMLLTVYSLHFELQWVQATGGDLDVSFGTSGKVITSFTNTADQAQAVALQEDGKIVAAGVSHTEESDHDFALARYNSDGSLDSSFGILGKVVTSLSNQYDICRAVALQQDGKIVAAGVVQTGNSAASVDFALVRYNSDGSLDPSFGTGGKVITDFFDASNEIHALVIQEDGKIIVAGQVLLSGTSGDFALARYNTDGTLDSSFGTGGKETTNFSGSLLDSALAIALQADGKIVAAGYANLRPVPEGTNSVFGVARYNTNGSLDTNFGTSGKVTVSFFDDGNRATEARGIAIQPDGNIVVAGIVGGVSSRQDFGLVRYDINGNLDPGFGANGKVTTSFFDHVNLAHAIALQSDGRIVVAGTANHPSTSSDFALARYNTDGTLDSSFGTGGKVTTNFQFIDNAYAAAIQSDGKVVAVGSSFSFSTREDFALARYQIENIDTIPPSVIVDAPTSTNYFVNQVISASYLCSDSGSGVATCSGSVPSGSTVDTATVGAKVFSVTSIDFAGNTVVHSTNYDVTYRIFFMYNTSTALKPRANQQIGIQLQDANDTNKSSTSITVTALRITPRGNSNTTVRTLSGNFTFDPALVFSGAASGGGYKYTFDARGLAQGDYDLVLSVASDPLSHTAPFTIR